MLDRAGIGRSGRPGRRGGLTRFSTSWGAVV